jgi:hypothetical protein
MTLPEERSRAVKGLGRAALGLYRYVHRHGKMVRVPREELLQITRWLRHYPNDYEMKIAAEKAPMIFGKEAPWTQNNPAPACAPQCSPSADGAAPPAAAVSPGSSTGAPTACTGPIDPKGHHEQSR